MTRDMLSCIGNNRGVMLWGCNWFRVEGLGRYSDIFKIGQRPPNRTGFCSSLQSAAAGGAGEASSGRAGAAGGNTFRPPRHFGSFQAPPAFQPPAGWKVPQASAEHYEPGGGYSWIVVRCRKCMPDCKIWEATSVGFGQDTRLQEEMCAKGWRLPNSKESRMSSMYIGFRDQGYGCDALNPNHKL